MWNIVRVRINSELRFLKYCIVHPFKGFFELKSEHRGSTGLSLSIMALLVLSSMMKATLTGYIFNLNYGESVSFIKVVCSILLPLLLFCIGNWCMSVIFEGEGTLNNLIVGVSYCLVPLIFSNILYTLLSLAFTQKEYMYLSFIENATILWVGILIIIAVYEIHQYSMLRTIVSTLITLLAMAVLLFVALLIFSLLQQMAVFVSSIYQEINYRM